MGHRHNALDEVTIDCGNLTLTGFSRAGLATYLQVPELDCLFDAGECPPAAAARNHVLLTHGHGDHSRCLLRHLSLRALFGIPKVPAYYMPAEIVDAFRNLMRADAAFGGIKDDEVAEPEIVGLTPHGAPTPLAHRKDLVVSAFAADHRTPSLGYTVARRGTRLRPELRGTPGRELARMRSQGIEVDDPVVAPLVTFLGDHRITTLRDRPEIWASRIVIIEATFLLEGEADLAHRRGHTHISELGDHLRDVCHEIDAEHIVLKHFSLRYSDAEISDAVFAAIPRDLHDRIDLLI